MSIRRIIFLNICSLLLFACDHSERPRTGQSIYYQSCVSCHEKGHGGAPIRGNQQQWHSRLQQGKAQLLENLNQGYKAMPPKGACFDCSHEELAMVLEFILEPATPAQ